MVIFFKKNSESKDSFSLSCLPTQLDLVSFLVSSGSRTKIIPDKDSQTGVVKGHLFLIKTDNTPVYDSDRINNAWFREKSRGVVFDHYNDFYRHHLSESDALAIDKYGSVSAHARLFNNHIEGFQSLNDVCASLGLIFRYRVAPQEVIHPMGMVHSIMRKLLLVPSIFLGLVSLTFIYGGVTGYAIVDTAAKSSLIGASAFILSLLGFYIYARTN
jgi:hypothetical protein